MAHYAFLDENNIVVEVIVGKNESENGIDWEKYYGDFRGLVCKRTSYNTIANAHREGGTPYRGNYAGVGHSYDPELDVFLPPKPSEDCILNTSTFTWDCP